MDQPIQIGVNRRLTIGLAALFGVLVVVGTQREVQAHSVLGVLITLTFIGSPFLFYMIRVLQRRPVLILDDRALTIGRSRQVIPWDSVFEVHLRQRQSMFGVYHHLVLTVQHDDKPDEPLAGLRTSKVAVQTVRQPIDQLSMSWSDIVALVQERLGKNVLTKYEAGMFRTPTG